MDVELLTVRQALRSAAEQALAAPSIFNTQPWQWRLSGQALRLRADFDRQLFIADPDSRLLLSSCGSAVHHARVAIAAAGLTPLVTLLPQPGDNGLLAEIHVGGPHEPNDEELAMHRAIPSRFTDRRPFTYFPVQPGIFGALATLVEPLSARLHVMSPEQVPQLSAATVYAEQVRRDNPAYVAELMRWTHRWPDSRDGVPTSTVPLPSARPVPMREFAPLGYGKDALPAGFEHDTGASYLVIYTDQDDRLDWLRAGEALSAVLLFATAQKLGTATISDVTELAETREQIGQMIGRAGYPQVAVRIGHAPTGQPPRSPRRRAAEVIIED